MKRAVFLDRDGVINHDRGYLYRIDDVEFVEGVFELCRAFRQRDYLLVVISNQSGIARGLYTEADFAQLSEWMAQQFARRGLPLAGIYHCPHHPEYGPIAARRCDCRKPKPGLLHRAIAEHAIDPAASVLIGDQASDIAAGEAAGIGWLIQVPSNDLRPAIAELARSL